MKAYALFMVAVLLSACAIPMVESIAHEGEARSRIYLVGHGWHTGLVIRYTDLPEGIWPEAGDFPQAEYLEVGWGDHDYYRSHDPGLWTTLKAAILPTQSVLHVAGFRTSPTTYFAASEVIELRLPHTSIEQLAKYIDAALAREGTQAVAPLGTGLYGDSRFYPAREMFHLFNTCNVWTARALRSAGLPVRDSITTEGLMSQIRSLGRVMQKAPPEEPIEEIELQRFAD